MKDSTKQRIFWIIIAVMIAAGIFAFSSQNTEKSEDLSDSVAEILHMEQAEQYTRISNQEIIFGLTLRKLAYVFLYALLGFSLYFTFKGIRARFPLAVGTAFCYGIWDEIHQTMSGRIGRWQDTLIDLGGILIGTGLALLIPLLLKRIKKWYGKRKEHRRLEQVLDGLSLASVLFYSIYRFLQSTMFQFYYSNRYKLLTIILPVVFGGIRFLYLVLKKYWADESHKEQSFFILRCILAFCLAIPFVLVAWMHDYKMLIYLPICCMCLYDMVPEKVCRAFVVTIGTCLAAVILCCLSGTVRNIVSTEGQMTASSYGIINTTDFASYFTYLLLAAWCSLRKNKWYTSLLFAAVSAAIIYSVYSLTFSRTFLYSGGLLIILVLWDCLEKNILRPAKRLRLFGKCVNWLSVLAFPAIGLLVVILVVRFASHDPWATELNTFFSSRLRTVLRPYQTYGIMPFGSTIEKLYGNGGTSLLLYRVLDYSYIDVGYALLAIRYGWVITAIVTGLWMRMAGQALKAEKNRFAFALLVIAFHAFSEPKFLDINYNVFLVMPFCAFSPKEKTIQETEVADKKVFSSLLIGIVVVGMFFFILPKTLSWLRTFFYLKKWNEGTAELTSFIFCGGMILLLLCLWKSTSLLVETRNRKMLIPFVSSFILMMTSILTMNATIEYGRKEQSDRLKQEEEIIQQIQEVATMPIYAAEPEELYARDGIALTKHAFSSELLVQKQATLFVGSNVDITEIISSGGQYCQISEKTGIYSYDPSVIEALSNAGYEWHRSYTGKRHFNLRDIAMYNDIKKNGQLIIHGSSITTNTASFDQLFGQYQVHFSLSNLSTDREGDVILLEVLGENGDRVLHQETLTASDFDAEGRCEYTMTYQTNPTPSVSYSITALRDVIVTIDDISWWRLPQKNEDLLHNSIGIYNRKSSGVQYTGMPDGTVTVTGEASDISFYNIYLNPTGFPSWMQKGKDYLIQINDPEEMVSFQLYFYDANQEAVNSSLVSTKTSQVFRIPDDAYGIMIRFRAWPGKPIHTTFTPIIAEYNMKP